MRETDSEFKLQMRRERAELRGHEGERRAMRGKRTQVQKDLIAAATVMQERGKSELMEGPDGSVCIMGAIYAATENPTREKGSPAECFYDAVDRYSGDLSMADLVEFLPLEACIQLFLEAAEPRRGCTYLNEHSTVDKYSLQGIK